MDESFRDDPSLPEGWCTHSPKTHPLEARLQAVSDQRDAALAALELALHYQACARDNCDHCRRAARMVRGRLDRGEQGDSLDALASLRDRERAEGKVEILDYLGCTCGLSIGNPILTHHTPNCAVTLLEAARKEAAK
jgi:hypothetical protein